MKWSILLLSLLSFNVIADYWFVEMTLGRNLSFTNQTYKWEDAGGIGALLSLGYVKDLKNNLFFKAQYTHASQLDKGPPWTNDAESSLDHFGIGIQKRW